MVDPRLDAYLARIDLGSMPPPDFAGLCTIQRAHRLAIAFENLDIPLGRGIAIGGDAVFAKLVTARRGGYCFEQNRLLADMLTLLGLPVRPLLARVWLFVAPDDPPPRTHTALLADLSGEPWLVDAGFGGGFSPPLPLRDGATATGPDGVTHRLRRWADAGTVQGEWLLERRPPAATEWQPQYSFDLAHVAQSDLDAANHWTATRPGTRFTTLHIASLTLPTGLAALTDRTFTLIEGKAASTRQVDTPDQWRAVLAEKFGIDLTSEEVATLPLFAS